MKLDVNQLRYLSKDELRTLQAVELGQKNHEIVPVPLADSIAGLKHGGTVRCLRALLRAKLVHHDSTSYDGYRLTNLGYDFLALHALVKRGAIAAVGRQIGVGKESDVFEVLSPEGERLALKLHRLGRTSFRAVQNKRDYLKHRTSFSWLYLSRLAALKEFAFMQALGEHGLPVPRAVAHSRHAVLMSMVDGVPLAQVRELGQPGVIYRKCMGLMVRLAQLGLVHCDCNEFNLMVDDEEHVTLIDFPQMVSTSHANAREWFEHDTACLHRVVCNPVEFQSRLQSALFTSLLSRFFTRKLGYIPVMDSEDTGVPNFEDALSAASEALDVTLAASGFKRSHQDALEQYTCAQARTTNEQSEAADGSTLAIESLDSAAELQSSASDAASSDGTADPADDDESPSELAGGESSADESEAQTAGQASQAVAQLHVRLSQHAAGADQVNHMQPGGQGANSTAAANKQSLVAGHMADGNLQRNTRRDVSDQQEHPSERRHAAEARHDTCSSTNSKHAGEHDGEGQRGGCAESAAEPEEPEEREPGVGSHNAAVRQRLVTERRAQQRQHAQARAGKEARKAASRKGRKSVAAALG